MAMRSQEKTRARQSHGKWKLWYTETPSNLWILYTISFKLIFNLFLILIALKSCLAAWSPTPANSAHDFNLFSFICLYSTPRLLCFQTSCLSLSLNLSAINFSSMLSTLPLELSLRNQNWISPMILKYLHYLPTPFLTVALTSFVCVIHIENLSKWTMCGWIYSPYHHLYFISTVSAPQSSSTASLSSMLPPL